MRSSQRRSLCAGPLYMLLLTVNALAAGSEFSYFGEPDLDYWKQAAPKGGATSTLGAVRPLAAPTKGAAQPGVGTFPWQKYSDPKNDEFFREGDYTPPAPFMEIARNPTDSNIENWFHYLETKNQLLHRLQEKLTAYAANHGQSLPPNMPALPAAMVSAAAEAPAAVARASARIGGAPAPRPDAKRFRLRLYFDSHCPHCEHMLSTTIRELSALGYWIELRQVDRDEAARAKIPFPVSPAPPEELKRYGIESVPVLLIGDIQKKSFFKMQGYQTAAAVLGALSDKR
ncbi:hypothetical protein WDW37_09365 [Bdellovibrionota bacterium FG-1]